MSIYIGSGDLYSTSCTNLQITIIKYCDMLKLYNANSATLLETLSLGIDGYCGGMANFHPALYDWLLDNSSGQVRPGDVVIALSNSGETAG